jgi:hypothetical protein
MNAISDSDVDRIARRVVELQATTLTQSEVLTRSEAMAYAKRQSHAAFSVWCAANHVRPVSRGRYSRSQLDLALQREARRRAA